MGPASANTPRVLHEDYARWAIGESYQQRKEFLDDLKEWWDHGMRVASRENEIVSVDITGNVAIVRMKTSETFAGPGGDAGGFEGNVVSVWLNEEGAWKLLSADIAPAPVAR
jgi:hypothetical protein